MTIDTKKIEERAVAEMKRLIASCDRLSESIQVEDKAMSIDGYIVVSTQSTAVKDGIIGKIPVQVKGVAAPSKSHEHCKRSVDVSDLRYYYEVEGGVLYFVVCGLGRNTPKVFYKALLPYDLKPLIDEAQKQGHKTKTLKFVPFPADAKNIERICRNFLMDKQKQASLRNTGIHDIETLRAKDVEISKFVLDRTVFKDEHLASAVVFSGDTYIYAVTPTGETFAVDKWSNASLVQRGIPRTICAGDFSLKETVMVGDADDGSAHISFPCFEIVLSSDGASLTYTDKGTFRRRADAASLVCAMLESQELCFDGMQLCKRLVPDPGAQMNVVERREQYAEVVALMDKMAIKSEWDPEKLSGSDVWKINLLIASVLRGKPVVVAQDLSLVSNVDICGERLKVCAKRVGESEYELCDLLGRASERFGVCIPCGIDGEDEKTIEIAPMLMFGVDDFKLAGNIDASMFANALDDAPIRPELLDYATLKLLDMLRAWDEGAAHPDDLLDCADVLASRIFKLRPDDPKHTINLLQISRRRGVLDEASVSRLKAFACQPECVRDPLLMVCVYILLEDDCMVRSFFGKLDDGCRKELLNWPIANLLHDSLRPDYVDSQEAASL